jgi:hypothetical protein
MNVGEKIGIVKNVRPRKVMGVVKLNKESDLKKEINTVSFITASSKFVSFTSLLTLENP